MKLALAETPKTGFLAARPILQRKLCCLFQVFISKSYDATSHFETTCKDVLDLFQKINNGEPFDFSKCKPEQADE